jgi:hypothetical protein
VHFAPLQDASVNDAIDAATDRPNVAFVTAALVPSNLGGVQGADILCQQTAQGAKLPGTFIALLSTSSQGARERLTSSRGWVRTDGAPVADTADDLLLGGHMLNPIDHDAAGNQMPRVQLDVWTGTDSTGGVDTVNGTCGDWTGAAGLAEAGFHDRSAPYEIATGAFDCAQQAHVYCFEVGHAVAVVPAQATGRIAFLGIPNSTVGLVGLDSQCTTDAMLAGLPGTYAAAVAVNGASAESRFPAGMPWHRIDGTLIAPTDVGLFSADLSSFVNQTANGAYVAGSFTAIIWSGASDGATAGTSLTTCSDWTAAVGTAVAGSPIDTSYTAFWSGTTATCSSAYYELCLQQ